MVLTLFEIFKRRNVIQRALQQLEPPIKLNETDTVIAVMGPHGAGKSSFIGAMTGNTEGVSHGLKSSTEFRLVRLECPERSSLGVVFIDTPGYDPAATLEEKNTLKRIVGYLPKGLNLPIAILYLHDISQNRAVKAPQNIELFKDTCSKPIDRLILTTTMWHDVTSEEGTEREEELRNEYWKSMITQGFVMKRYDGTPTSAWKIVEDLIQGSNRQADALLSIETSDLGISLAKKKGGAEVYRRFRRQVEQQQKILNDIRKQILNGGVELNLKTEYEVVRKKAADIAGEIRALRVPLGKYLDRFISTPMDWSG